MLPIILLFTILTTSFISGVLGMAGGMILMGVLTLFLTPISAMLLHGCTQLVSNGSRAWMHRNHIQWKLLPPYFVGAALVSSLFFGFQWVAPKSVIFIILGLFPLISLALPKNLKLSMTRPWHSLLCGLVVTGTQLLAGASGPVLDVFYIHSSLNRFQIIASKALTQSVGHGIKIVYYGSLWSSLGSEDLGLDLWTFPLAAIVATTGSYLGKHSLHRLGERHFQLYSKVLIIFISLFYLSQGLKILI